MNGWSAFWTAFGLGNAIANSRMQKKRLAEIQDINNGNQGIIGYDPSPIEAFFLDTEPLTGVALSGGDPAWRIRAVARAIECAYQQGYMPVVVHCQNRSLENHLMQCFGQNSFNCINDTNPVYDPFLDLDNATINRLIMSACPSGYEIRPAGRYYLDGISDYIRANGKHPAAYMFIRCPHLTLMDQVHKAEMNGRMDAEASKRILSQLLQGELERGSIESFFSMFGQQSLGVLADKAHIGEAVSVRNAIRSGKGIMIDVISSANIFLQNMLLSEIHELITLGAHIITIIDGLPVAANEIVRKHIQGSGNNEIIVIASDDLYSSFAGNDNDFYAFIGKTSKVIISRHISAHSCQKFSDVIGSYDKIDVSASIANNTSFSNQIGFGNTNISNMSIKRESIVKPEIINRMSDDEVFVVSKAVGELSYVKIV